MSQIPLGMLKEIEFSFSEQIYESVLSVCLSVSPSLSLSLSLSTEQLSLRRLKTLFLLKLILGFLYIPTDFPKYLLSFI